MRRREILLGSLATAACASSVRAQTSRLPVIAVLSINQNSRVCDTLASELARSGWTVGQTVSCVLYGSGGRIENLHGVVQTLLTNRVDVIVALSGTAAAAAAAATREFPIVMAASGFDPIGAGWAASYARPGGNVTGLTLANDEAIDKQLELLKEIAPSIRHLGLLRTRGNEANRVVADRALAVASTFGLAATVGEVAGSAELTPALNRLRLAGADALLVVADPAIDPLRQTIAEFAIRYGLPTVGQISFYADAGFLITYAPDIDAVHRRAAVFVDRILRGAKPGDLPIERPSRFVLTLNAKTAASIGLTIPPALTTLADEVIE